MVAPSATSSSPWTGLPLEIPGMHPACITRSQPHPMIHDPLCFARVVAVSDDSCMKAPSALFRTSHLYRTDTVLF